MDIQEAYIYMFRELSTYYKKTYNDELGAMLGGFDTAINGKPIDPAAWVDWSDAVKKVTKRENLSSIDVNTAIIKLLQEYNDHHGFKLKDVIRYFKKREKHQKS